VNLFPSVSAKTSGQAIFFNPFFFLFIVVVPFNKSFSSFFPKMAMSISPLISI